MTLLLLLLPKIKRKPYTVYGSIISVAIPAGFVLFIYKWRKFEIGRVQTWFSEWAEMGENEKDILLPGDIELYVKHVEPTMLEDLGTPLWFESHHRLEKLNQQAAVEAAESREETVKDLIIFHEKVPVLIHEVITIQVWREKVFRQIMRLNGREPRNTFVGYIILYHEITAAGLLQNILYHKDSVQGIDDAALDLIDYSASEIVRLLSQVVDQKKTDSDPTKTDEIPTDRTNLQELKFQSETIGFNVGLAAISILRYLIEHQDELTLSATSRLYTTHDVPLLMTNLIRSAPWKRMNPKTNIVQVYDSGTWKNADKVPGVSKHEAQCWISLQYLLLDNKCSTHYEMNDFRKQHFLKLQKHLTEIVIDQISPLMRLKQYLARLSVGEPGSENRRPLIMETVPEIKTRILNRGFKKWKKIAAKHIGIIFDGDKETTMEIARRLGETYDIDHLERLDPEGPICSGCGDPASKRCSQCKTEWYCGRECQVKRWGKHKAVCQVMSERNRRGGGDD